MLKLIAKLFSGIAVDDGDGEFYRDDFVKFKMSSDPCAHMSRLESGQYSDPGVEDEWRDFSERQLQRDLAW